MGQERTDTDFCLGGVTISPTRLRLAREGHVLNVQPRVMDVIVELARAGGVASRETLEGAVWRDENVSYHAVARAVSQARKSLAEVSGGLIRIEAIPRRGYRLVVDSDPAAASGTGRVREALLKDWQGRIAVAVAVLAVGLAASAAGLHGSPWHFGALAALALAAALDLARHRLQSRA